MTIRAVGTLPTDLLARAAGADRLAGLEDVLAWCRARDAELVDVIVQDEFTHDVIVRAGASYLCFDST